MNFENWQYPRLKVAGHHCTHPSPIPLDNIRSEEHVRDIVGDGSGNDGRIKFRGLTPLGTMLRQHVIDPIVFKEIPRFRKPYLVIVITDGQPAGEPRNALEDTIKYTIDTCRRMRPELGHPVAFEIAQVGNDQKAREFLSELDSNPTVGAYVDCTSSTLNVSKPIPL